MTTADAQWRQWRDHTPAAREHVRNGLTTLFDPRYYALQAGRAFPDLRAALGHYLTVGGFAGLDPHPLFDTKHYVRTQPDAATSGLPPLVHFLEIGERRGANPSPFFDTGYYHAQDADVAKGGVSALAHYVERAFSREGADPNALFANGRYIRATEQLVQSRENPLLHYLTKGSANARSASPLHADVMRLLGETDRPGLSRGQAGRLRVVFVVRGEALARVALAAADPLAERGLDLVAAFVSRPEALGGEALPAGMAVLDDLGADVVRPAAVSLLALSLAARRRTAFLVTDSADAIAGARFADSLLYYVALEDAPAADVRAVAGDATRMVVGSHDALDRAEDRGVPVNVAVRRLQDDAEGPARFARSLLELTDRDYLPPRPRHRARRGRGRGARIVIPCIDWSLSGVNAALETVGQELMRRGWDVEILFTRTPEWVEESAAERMPALPYRFLERSTPGVEAMWEALIADLETRGPAILFGGYDFVANSVVPALSERVGAVLWTQSDDGDYYEQAYRLGRYCNAVVCVSHAIRDQIAAHNPLIGERAEVIHNTSVREEDVDRPRTPREEQIRLVYTGRLVQYQKRILDFVPLADALAARGADFRIDLVGSFTRHDPASIYLPRRAAAHLEEGRIRLPGRVPREAVLEKLRAADMFVLLSDFEGFPLSLVEAMAAGCVPISAAMQSGIPELVRHGHNGLIQHGRDYAVWADAIIELHQDSDRLDRLSANAQETIREAYTIEQIGAQFDDLFTRITHDLETGNAHRPPTLKLGAGLAVFGDVLPPPSMHRAVTFAGM